MTSYDDPPRLSDGPLAELLRGARRDAPRDDERAALDAALRTALRPPAPFVTSRWPWAVGVVGAAALATWALTRPPRAPSRVQPTARPAPAVVVAPAPPREEVPPVAAHVPAVDDAGGPRDASVLPAPLRCVPARHVAAVDEARGALRGHDLAAALAVTARDRQLCPRGALREERERITVEALARQGRRVEAARYLAAFERAYPTSLHLRALRALVDSASQGGLPSTP